MPRLHYYIGVSSTGVSDETIIISEGGGDPDPPVVVTPPADSSLSGVAMMLEHNARHDEHEGRHSEIMEAHASHEARCAESHANLESRLAVLEAGANVSPSEAAHEEALDEVIEVAEAVGDIAAGLGTGGETVVETSSPSTPDDEVDLGGSGDTLVEPDEQATGEPSREPERRQRKRGGWW